MRPSCCTTRPVVPSPAAYAGRILVHSTLVPAALDAQGIDALPGWLSVEPDPPDITFSRGADVLRDAPACALRLPPRVITLRAR